MHRFVIRSHKGKEESLLRVLSIVIRRGFEKLFSHPLLVYLIVALAFLGPALGSGYLLTLDMVFAPSMNFPAQIYGINQNIWASLPYLVVLQSASAILPGWLVQKIIIVMILVAAGWGVHRLVGKGGVSSYYAGLLYMINPYTGVRLIAGQWTLLATYAVIPFAVSALFELFETRSTRSALKVAILWTLSGVFQLHGFVILGLAFLIIGISQFVRTQNRVCFAKSLARPVAVLSVGFVLLNLFWLTRLTTTSLGRINRISDQALELFAPVSTSGLPVEFDVAAMQGFWRAGLIPDNTDEFWGLLFIGVLFFSLLGLIAGVHTRWSNREMTFACIGIVGFILALGMSSNVSSPIFEAFTSITPLMRGFRDSHKFVALVILAYVYLGALGIEDIFRFINSNSYHLQTKRIGTIISQLGLLLLVVPIFVPLLYGASLFGFAGQVRPTEFPTEWYEANEFINQAGYDSNVLVLPWHQYMDFHWLDQPQRRLSNPSRLFFDSSVVISDNLEIGNLYSESVDPVSEYIELILAERESISNLGSLLVPLNVKFVILLKDADFDTYSFLEKQSDLILVLSNTELMLFENTRTTGLGFRVPPDTIVQSSSDTALDVRLPFGNDVDFQNSPVVIDVVSPIKFFYESPDAGFLGVEIAQGTGLTGWKVDGNDPIGSYLGFIPVFSSKDVGSAERNNFYMLSAISYTVSFVTLVIFLGSLAAGEWNRRNRKS